MWAVGVCGAQVVRSTPMTLNPSKLGLTTQNWLGWSQYASDAYLKGKVDELRVYNRAITVAEVTELYTQRM